jgi:GxxExxY protein
MKDQDSLVVCRDELIEDVIGVAIKVHTILGPGLLESVYEHASMFEFAEAKIPAQRQVEIPVIYRGRDLGVGFRADIIVADSLLLEFKAVDRITDIHIAQTITYLKLLKFKRGLILNFNAKLLKEGIKRVSM